MILYKYLFFVIFMSTSFSYANDLTLILNSENAPGKLPRNFRTTNDSWLRQPSAIIPSRVGLDKLNASGSGQFSASGLQEILKRINTSMNIIIVDLRQESHGFANGIAVSWYADRDAANVGKTLSEIENDELKRLRDLIGKEVIINRIISKPQDVIAETEPIKVHVKEVCTENELTKTRKIGYFRIPVTDHIAPSKENVERFLTFVKGLPANTWLHFHCEAGDGRTTTFLSMYDMIHNAKQVSFEEIIERQYLLGGINLVHMPSKDKWKYPYAVERSQFLKQFYEQQRR